MVTSSVARGSGLQQRPAPDAAAQHLPARTALGDATLGTLNNAVLQLQRASGNHAVEALLRRSAGKVSDRAAGAPLALVQRSVASGVPTTRIQRQGPYDQPNVGPAVPQLPLPPMFGVGGTLGPDFTPGSPYVKGSNLPGLGSTPNIPLDPTQIPKQIQGLLPKSPAAGPTPGGPAGPGACAPGMYNKLWQKCCDAGTHADDSGMNCVPDAAPALPSPAPAPSPQPGDFPIPDPNANSQLA